MKLVVFGKQEMRETILPDEIQGKYALSRPGVGKQGSTEFVTVEAHKGKWAIRATDSIEITYKESVGIPQEFTLEYGALFRITDNKVAESYFLFVEPKFCEPIQFLYFRGKVNEKISIGNTSECDIIYDNIGLRFAFAMSISFNNSGARVTDLYDDGMRNNRMDIPGFYLNQKRFFSAETHFGDVIYVYGMRVVIGRNFVAVQQIGTCPKSGLRQLTPPHMEEREDIPPIEEAQYFSSSPRNYPKVKKMDIKVECPPRPEIEQDTPTAIVMGPAITMAMASGVTGAVSIMNNMQNHAPFSTMLPTVVMMGSMMAGSILWPTIGRLVERSRRRNKNIDQYTRYEDYIEELIKETERNISTQEQELRSANPSLINLKNRVAVRESSLWERRLEDEDFMTVSVGIGELPMMGDVEYPAENRFEAEAEIKKLLDKYVGMPKRLRNVPISYSFACNLLTGIVGKRETVISFVKGVLLQLITLHGNDDLRLVFVYSKDEPEWEHYKWLPHVWTEDKMIKYMADTVDELKVLFEHLKLITTMREGIGDEIKYEAPHYLLVLANQRLAEKSEYIKDLYKTRQQCGITAMLLYDDRNHLPKSCTNVIHVTEEGITINDYRNDPGNIITADNSIFYEESIEEICIQLSNIKTDDMSENKALPESLSFFDLLEIGKPEHVDLLGKWKKNDPTKSLAVPIGIDCDGNAIMLDVHEKAHGPHGLIAGSTGSGKSEFIISYIAMMALNFKPSEVSFILIDFKGGGMADVFKGMPHIAGTITNLDGSELKRSLLAIQTELERRQRIFKESSDYLKISNIDIYRYQALVREGRISQPLSHLIIIVDEFAELKQQQDGFLEQLIRIARIGRSLGVHLILATQKPDGVVDDQIKSNIKFKICLRVQDKADSQSMLDRPDAAMIRVPGRFYFQVGMNEVFELGQSPFSGANYIPSDKMARNMDDSIVLFNGLDRLLLGARDISAPEKKTDKQIDVFLQYLKETCAKYDIFAKPLWLEKLPGPKSKRDREFSSEQVPFELNPIIGKYDDLRAQQHKDLSIPFSSEGNVILYGAAGSGTLEFLYRMIYSIIENHSEEEVQIYLLDFESASLTAFEEAPQVNSVYQSYQTDQIGMLFEMISGNLEDRKKRFSRYGGKYANYIRNSGKTIPNELIVIHNYSAFSEMCEEEAERLISLSREGVQYGLYFIITAFDPNAVRNRTSVNFKQVYCLQMNNEDAYYDILGKTDGLYPSIFLGRGIFKRNNITYEFQTDILFPDATSTYDEVKKYLKGIKSIKMQSDRVEDMEMSSGEAVQEYSYLLEKRDIRRIPIGYSEKTGKIVSIDLSDKVKYPIILSDHGQDSVAKTIIESIHFVLPEAVIINPDVLDVEALDHGLAAISTLIHERYDEAVSMINNGRKIPNFDYRYYLIYGFGEWADKLDYYVRNQFILDMKAVSPNYHVKLVFISVVKEFEKAVTLSIWNEQYPFENGIWIGNPDFVTKAYKEQYDVFKQRDNHGLAWILVDGKSELAVVPEGWQ